MKNISLLILVCWCSLFADASSSKVDSIHVKAVEQGFHIDEAINGFPIESIRHSGSHPNYSNIVRSKLDNLDLNNSTFMTDFQNIMLDIETAIINNPNTHINQLIF